MTTVATLKQISIAKALAPRVHYHPEERYFLADANTYFDSTDPVDNPDGKRGRVLKPSIIKEMGFGEDALETDGGTPARDAYAYPKLKPKAPVHFAVIPSTDGVHYYIQYWLFWAYNGPKRSFGLVPTGSHSADIETIAVKVREADHTVVEYNMTNHGDFVRFRLDNQDGHNTELPAEIVGPEGAPMIRVADDGRPVVYTALDGHGMYNEPGSYLRISGLGNDVCAAGPSTDVEPVEVLPGDRLLEWDGRFGDDGVNGYSFRLVPDKEKIIERHMRIPGPLAWSAYLAYLAAPVLVFVALSFLTKLSDWVALGCALGAFFAQFYVLKAAMTLIFPLVGAPTPEPDEWWRWFLPLRFD